MDMSSQKKILMLPHMVLDNAVLAIKKIENVGIVGENLKR